MISLAKLAFGLERPFVTGGFVLPLERLRFVIKKPDKGQAVVIVRIISHYRHTLDLTETVSVAISAQYQPTSKPIEHTTKYALYQ